jgi:hypothetical protein
MVGCPVLIRKSRTGLDSHVSRRIIMHGSDTLNSAESVGVVWRLLTVRPPLAVRSDTSGEEVTAPRREARAGQAGARAAGRRLA